MKKTLFILIFLIFANSEGFTQNDNTVVITTIGSGSTYENAKVNALRSALEQVSGAYLSSNTLIINDKLISDNISTITTGSINKFEILGQIVSNNQFFVTIKSEIIPSKFAEFVSGKTGSSVTVKGGLYAANIKQLNLNEKAELEAVKQLSDLYSNLLYESIYFDVKANTPVEANEIKEYNPIQYYILPIDVTMRFTSISDSINDYLKLNLKQICLTDDEKKAYEEIPREIYSICIDNILYFFRNKSCPVQLLKFNKEISKIDYSNSFSVTIGKKSYTRYIKWNENEPNAWVNFSGNVLLIEDLNNIKYISINYEQKIIKGFNSAIKLYSWEDCYKYLYYTNFITYQSELLYFVRSKAFAKNIKKFDIAMGNCIKLWTSSSSWEMKLNGYFTLNEIEEIENVIIKKNDNCKVKFIK
jgi:hypothetical protein